MIVRHWSETPLAWISLVAAITHFTLETWYHVTWGQPVQALLVDYICLVLMMLGSLRSLRVKPNSAAGLLAAAWAFALGFAWRSVFGRLELLEAGKQAAHGEAGFVLPILIGALAAVAVLLAWALWLAWRQTKPTGL